MDELKDQIRLKGFTPKSVAGNTSPQSVWENTAPEAGSGDDPEFEGELEEMLYARHVEVSSFQDLKEQRGTPIPALFNQFYKYIQNPSSVSVETFKRMVDTDDTIGSGIDFLTTCLAARIGKYQHINPKITEFVNIALSKLDNGWQNSVKEMLSASWAGFMVAEKVWTNDPMGFILKKLVTLPPSTILFETDRVGELTSDGILQYQRNYNPALFGSGPSYLFGFLGTAGGPAIGNQGRNDPFAKIGDFPFPLRTANTFSYLSIRIPKMKCVHYAFDAQGKFGNPYGRSLLRRAYKYYVMEDAILQMMAVALDRKGTPLTIVYADPNATLMDSSKTQTGVDYQGQDIGVRSDVAAMQAFKNIHNDSTIILPGKKGQIFETDFVPQQSNAGDFIAALEYCKKGKMRALLLPSLIFTSGDGSGSFALGQEHARTFDKLCDGILSGFKQTILDQIIYELIAYNFPKEEWETEGLGDFTKRELTQEERDKELTSLKTAYDMGAVDVANDLDDLNHVRASAGLKPRETLIVQPEVDDMGGLLDGNEDPEDGDGEKKPPVKKPGSEKDDKNGKD
jgi:hypothetical protein